MLNLPFKYNWDLAINPNSHINDSPYHFITGSHVDVTQLHPIFACCYVFIPTSERESKVVAPRSYKAHFVCSDYTSKLTCTYQVIEVCAVGRYRKVRSSKDVIFDHFINFRSACPSAMPTDDAFDLARRLPVSGDSDAAPSRVRFADHERKHCAYQPNLRLTRTLLRPCSASHPKLLSTHDGPNAIETMTPLMQLMFQCEADLGDNLDNEPVTSSI